MDRDLEEQIDELIHKATKDLRTRIVRVVVRHQNKLLKDQARELKSGTNTTGGRTATASSTRKPVAKKASSAKKESRYHSDSDSDGYYSE